MMSAIKNHTQPEQRSRQAAWSLIAGVTLLHLLVAPGIGLSVDEAHYALYGLHLDWSYFDHPPMVGWLQAVILPFAQSDFALRLIPIALSAAASVVLYQLALELFPDQSQDPLSQQCIFAGYSAAAGI